MNLSVFEVAMESVYDDDRSRRVELANAVGTFMEAVPDDKCQLPVVIEVAAILSAGMPISPSRYASLKERLEAEGYPWQ